MLHPENPLGTPLPYVINVVKIGCCAPTCYSNMLFSYIKVLVQNDWLSSADFCDNC